MWKHIQYVAYTPLKLVCKQYICKKRWKKFCRVIFNVFLSFVNVVPILCVRKLEKRTVTSSVFEKKKNLQNSFSHLLLRVSIDLSWDTAYFHANVKKKTLDWQWLYFCHTFREQTYFQSCFKNFSLNWYRLQINTSYVKPAVGLRKLPRSLCPFLLWHALTKSITFDPQVPFVACWWRDLVAGRRSCWAESWVGSEWLPVHLPSPSASSTSQPGSLQVSRQIYYHELTLDNRGYTRRYATLPVQLTAGAVTLQRANQNLGMHDTNLADTFLFKMMSDKESQQYLDKWTSPHSCTVQKEHSKLI